MTTGETRNGPPPIPPETLKQKKETSPELQKLLTAIIDAQPPKQEQIYNLTEETKFDDAEHLQETGTLVEGEPVGFFAYDGNKTIREDRVQHEIHVATPFAQIDSITRSGVKDTKRKHSEDGHSARIDRDQKGRKILTVSVIDGAGSTGNGAVGAKTINQLLEQHLTTFKPGQSDIERVIEALWKTDQEAAKQFGTKEAYACVACGQIIEDNGRTYGIFSNIGDSRVQIVRGGKIMGLSDLQNLPNFLAASSKDKNTNPNDRYNEQNGNVITAALGKLKDKENPYSFGMTERDYKQYLLNLNKENNDPNIQFTTPNIIMVDLEPGDRVIMYGDGLSDIQDPQVLAEKSANVTDNTEFIEQTFRKARDIGEQKTPQIIEGYNNSGKKEKIQIGREGKYVNGDDLTIMSVEIKGTPSNTETARISYETKQRAALQASMEKEQRETQALQDARKNIQQMSGVATLEAAANNVISSLTNFGVSLAGDIEKNITNKLADLQAIMSNEKNKNIVSKTWDTIKGFFNRKKETALTEAQKQYDQLSVLLETYKNTKLPTTELSGEWEKIKTTLETQSTEAIKSVLANMKALAKKYGAQYDKRVAYVEQLLAQRADNTSTETPLPQNVQGEFEVEKNRSYDYPSVLDNKEIELEKIEAVAPDEILDAEPNNKKETKQPKSEFTDAEFRELTLLTPEEKQIFHSLDFADKKIIQNIIQLLNSGKHEKAQLAIIMATETRAANEQDAYDKDTDRRFSIGLRNQILNRLKSKETIISLNNEKNRRTEARAAAKASLQILENVLKEDLQTPEGNRIAEKGNTIIQTAKIDSTPIPKTQQTLPLYGASLTKLLYRYNTIDGTNGEKIALLLGLQKKGNSYTQEKMQTKFSTQDKKPYWLFQELNTIPDIHATSLLELTKSYNNLTPKERADVDAAVLAKTQNDDEKFVKILRKYNDKRRSPNFVVKQILEGLDNVNPEDNKNNKISFEITPQERGYIRNESDEDEYEEVA